MKNEFLETIKASDGKVFYMPYHQARYESVLRSLGERKMKNLSDYINPPPRGLFRCRLVYTSADISITYHEYKKRAINSLKLIYDDTIEYSLKSTNRSALDKLFALKQDADDILIIKNSLVTDTSIANIAFYDGSKWITPKRPLLHGTTRTRLLDEGKIFEADISVDELKGFSKVALLNAMIHFDVMDRCDFLI
ncbi:aminotransferase class IV family protein [bacterium]|nr:aminotransferase class IV family protein [bacterium]MBU1989461.1 aminotransferase class IV family protein [bacterium]